MEESTPKKQTHLNTLYVKSKLENYIEVDTELNLNTLYVKSKQFS